MARSYQPTAPGIFSAFYPLVQQSAAQQNAPFTGAAVSVFPFALGSYVPGTYIAIHAIDKDSFSPEDTAGGFNESYDLEGQVVVWTGEGINDTQGGMSNVTVDVMNYCWSLFVNCVLMVWASNRNQPILGYSDASGGAGPWQSNLGFAEYAAEPGEQSNMDGTVSPWGWKGTIDWALHFDAIIWPFSTS